MRHKSRMENVKFAEIPYPTNIHQAGLADLSKSANVRNQLS